MNIEVKAVHFEVSEQIRTYIDKKLPRLYFAREHLVDLLFTLTQERRGFRIEVNINFRWGTSNHVRVDSFDIFEGIDKLFDKMECKINKEKKKIQDHKGKDSVRTTEIVLEET
ncbi:Ribosome hibernation promoting factor [subsurface metagenome]